MRTPQFSASARWPLPRAAHTPQPDEPPVEPGEPDAPPIGDPPSPPGEVPRAVPRTPPPRAFM